MDAYVPIYCTRCAQLQFRACVGKSCEFCGHTEFAPIRPKPTLTLLDLRALKRQVDNPIEITVKEKKQ